MAVIDFIHRGIKYVSDENGCFRYKNCNYLKFHVDQHLIDIYKINIAQPMDLYINSITPGEGVLYIVELSLSQKPNTDLIPQVITTNKAAISGQLNMPEAKIKFHPNGGVAASGKSINDLDKCSTSQNTFSEKNLWDVNSLFTKVGYTGTGWTLLHPTNKDQSLTILQTEQVETSNDRFMNKIEANDDYIITYPETHYYVYANWTPKQYKIQYCAYDGTNITTQNVNYKTIYLGTFAEKRDAIISRVKAEQEYFGEFAPQRHLFDEYEIKPKIEV